MYTVVDHDAEVPGPKPIPAVLDTTEMCRFAPTSVMCFISPSTSCQPVIITPTTIPSNFTTVQQNKVSGDDCNVTAIVVPIVLVIVASTVIMCVVIFMAVRWKKTSGMDLSTTKKDQIICVVKNDLYELVR